jgi:hypothetical protein
MFLYRRENDVAPKELWLKQERQCERRYRFVRTLPELGAVINQFISMMTITLHF